MDPLQRVFSCDQHQKEFSGQKKYANHKRSHVGIICKMCDLQIPSNSRGSHNLKCSQNNEKVAFSGDHYKQYFEFSGKTMKFTNGEFVETAHNTLRLSDENRGTKVVRKLGTPIHQSKSLQSHVMHNSTRAGWVTPTRIRKKPSNQSPLPSSPLTLPSSLTPSPASSLTLAEAVSRTRSPFPNYFKRKYPDSVAAHYREKFNKTCF